MYLEPSTCITECKNIRAKDLEGHNSQIHQFLDLAHLAEGLARHVHPVQVPDEQGPPPTATAAEASLEFSPLLTSSGR
jgi:hypothetical protein